MKYCIKYNKNLNSIIKEVDELIIDLNQKSDILSILDFLQEHCKKRIVVSIRDWDFCIKNKILDFFSSIQEEYPDLNFTIRLPYYNKEYENLIKKYNINFFFNEYIKDWDKLIGFLELKVSDVYITETLMFELDKVAAIAHSKGVQIRTFPNVSQTSFPDINSLKSAFIRPEDVEEYEPYIDVFEFFEDKKVKTYYDIYKKDKKWFGKLNEIIIGLKSDIDSRYIIPRFAKKRVKCKKECLKGGKCKMCDTVLDLSKNLEKANMIIRKEEE